MKRNCPCEVCQEAATLHRDPRHDVQRPAFLLFALLGVVVWIEGGPHPRTWGAWLLLVAILIVSALPALFYRLFC